MRIVVTDSLGRITCADVGSQAVVIELPGPTRMKVAGMTAGKEDMAIQTNDAVLVQVIPQEK